MGYREYEALADRYRVPIVSSGFEPVDLLEGVLMAIRQLEVLDEQALLPIQGESIAFTTDSFVVTPIFFPGGDIGELAVNGTVNDLAMGGATPRFLSLAFILEEGFAIADLRRILGCSWRMKASSSRSFRPRAASASSPRCALTRSDATRSASVTCRRRTRGSSSCERRSADNARSTSPMRRHYRASADRLSLMG